MSFPRYRKYKDSGVEWLGEVPGHWAAPPLYLRYSVELGKMLDSSRITGHHLVPYLRNVDVQWGRINFNDLPEMDIEASEYGRYTVAPGDLLVCEGGEVGRAAILPERSGTIGFQKALHRLRVLADDEHPAFMYFTLSWAALRGVFNQSGLSTIAHLTGEQLRKYRFPKPPIAEQTAIAAFLDRETAKIDALVAEQQSLIALLKEKRHALISHAVTKGLDPDVPMKDSGVAWLGEVPAHWEIGPLKRFAEVIDCKHHTVEFLDEGLPIVSIRELRDDRIDLSDAKRTSQAEWDFLREGRAPQAGDLIFCRNASVGAVGYVEAGQEFCMGQDVCLIRPETTSRFTHFQLSSSIVREQIEVFLVGATIRRANVAEIRGLVMTWPPVPEQARISEYLIAETAQFDELMQEAETTIALLQERRTALISAAVTGKIDVRHLAVATAGPTPEPA